MSDWDARGWIADIMGLDPGGVTVRSIDRYGESETQVRFVHAGEVVARLTVTGPVRPFGTPEGQGHWELKAQIGPGVQDVHLIERPETDRIVYE
jgi:hypothetical protein